MILNCNEGEKLRHDYNVNKEQGEEQKCSEVVPGQNRKGKDQSSAWHK